MSILPENVLETFLLLKIHLGSSIKKVMSQKGRVILKEYFKAEKIPS
jgi:hypothetical protein